MNTNKAPEITPGAISRRYRSGSDRVGPEKTAAAGRATGDNEKSAEAGGVAERGGRKGQAEGSRGQGKKGGEKGEPEQPPEIGLTPTQRYYRACHAAAAY